MSTARKSVWTIIATLAVVATTLATSVISSDAASPVQDANPATAATDLDDVPRVDPPTTTTTEQPTTTTAPTTTTTAAPTTTAPPAPPPTTAAPPPPPPPPAAAATPSPPAPRHGARNSNCEQYMHNQINAARGNSGRAGLAFDGGIQYIAVNWSDHLAGTQNLAHNPNFGDQILAHRDYRTAGENVGRGHDLGQLFQAFMDSPGHRENIVSSAYSHVTVGCLTDGGGQYWVTQNFWG